MLISSNIHVSHPIILFDGICNLCNYWVQFIIQHDKNNLFKLCSAQSPEGQLILKSYGYPTQIFSSMLYLENNCCYEKSQAFFKIVVQLGYPFLLLSMFKIFPNVVNNWVYDRIARNRYRLFGKATHCILTFAGHEHRFLKAEEIPQRSR